MVPVLCNLYHWMQNILRENLLNENYFVTTTEQFIGKANCS